LDRLHSEHHSFLLRLWKDSEFGDWRVSMKDLITLETFLFPDLTSFIGFLQEKNKIYGPNSKNFSGKEKTLYKELGNQ
jgi:hypothetical protein